MNSSRLNYQTYNGSNFILSENYLEKRFPTDISIDRIMYKILNIDNDEFYLTNVNSLPLGYIKLRNGVIVKIYDLKHNEVSNINYILK